MSKQKAERFLANNEAIAIIKGLRVTPRKLGLVAGLIQGMKASEALIQLTFLKKRVAVDVKKGLQSAIANAENNHNLDVDRLYIKEATVGKGLVLRRFHARGRGRAAPVKKSFSQIRIVLEQVEEE